MTRKNNLLAEVERAEAEVFRAGQYARALLTKYPKLPIESVRLSFLSDGVRVELSTDGLDDAKHVCATLGLPVTTGVHKWPTVTGGYEHVIGQGPVDDVKVLVVGTRTILDDEEIKRLQAAEKDTPEAGDLGEFVTCANRPCVRGEWLAKAAERGWEKQADGTWLDPQCAAHAEDRLDYLTAIARTDGGADGGEDL